MVGIKRQAGRVLLMAALAVLATSGGLLLTPSAALAGQGGGQSQPGSDNSTLWLVSGLVIVMVAAGVGLYFTRRGK